MRTINIHEAKTHLSRLVDEAEKGDSFIIAKAGKPKVKVIRIDEPDPATLTRIGFMKGMYTLPDNFEELDREMDKEIERLMLGEDEDREDPAAEDLATEGRGAENQE